MKLRLGNPFRNILLRGLMTLAVLWTIIVVPTGTSGRDGGLAAVAPYADVRNSDLRAEDPTSLAGVLPTLWFNLATQWPASLQAQAASIMEAGKNPGLGVREIHSRGITGRGVRVAIIDQPLQTSHPEYTGKIVAYRDFGCGASQPVSMHGPAVAGLLVGRTIGTAPEAILYYAAVPSWLLDAGYYADALNWLVSENQTLPVGDKIRVVSVSAAPSGPGSPYTKNRERWDEACQSAGNAGMVVLDCTNHRGIIGACYYNPQSPEDISLCTAGFPGQSPPADTSDLLAPTSCRTQAEQWEAGMNGYQHMGRGGLSWGIPWVAGLLAMGWQLCPSLSGSEITSLLGEAAFQKGGFSFINPQEFIRILQLNITLEARREEERAWLVRRFYGRLEISAENRTGVLVDHYAVFRRAGDEDYQEIGRLAAAELASGQAVYNDFYLEGNVVYAYRLGAFDSSGNLITYSNEKVI